MKNLRLCFTMSVAFLALTAGSNGNASDCQQATTKVERLICSPSHDQLEWLDELLNSEYKRALSRAGAPENLRASQRNWIKQKRDTCSNVLCLRREYVARIAQISKSTDDIEGVYLTNGACFTEPWQDKNGDFIGKECKPSPIDHLMIEKVSDNQYHVITNVSQFVTGNFECSADAYMLRKGSTLQLTRWSDPENFDPKCLFSIGIKSDKFEFHANGEQCSLLCGRNGNFDGETFPRKSNAK